MTLAGPYRGLSPFAEADAPYFFGRDRDRRVIVANLIGSPLTLLYAPSGVGKTSVLCAGVNPAVRQLKRDDGTPEYMPVVVRNWSGDGLAAIHEALAHSTGHQFGNNGATLADRLAATATELGSTVLLVLDQFEEFMLYHGDEVAPGEVAWELTRVMTDRDLPARVMLGMREDSLAMLDRFKGRVPRLFSNYLRLEHLDFDAARDAILRPLDEWNTRHPDDVWEAEEDLVEAVIEDVASGQVDLGRTGGGARTNGAARHVETAFLQLVMTKLWEEERAHGSQCLQVATLRKLGGASSLVRTHVDRRMRTLTRRQRNLAAEAFHQLVTPSGTKVAQSAGDLAEYANASPTAVTTMLDTLSSGEWWILRRVEGDGRTPRYEVFHDVLAEAVLDWRARHEERRRRARLIRFGALAVVLIACAALLAAKFERNAQTAKAEELAATAREELASDPDGAVAHAAQAVDKHDKDTIRATLRMALMQAEANGIGHARGETGRVRSLHVSRDGRRIATANSDDQVQVWNLADGAVQTYSAPKVNTLSFSSDGRRVAAGGKAREVLVLGDGDVQRVPMPGESTFVRWSPTGDVLLVGQDKSATIVDLASGSHTVIGGGRGGQFSPGGSRVVTSTPKGVVRIWNLKGKPVGRRLPGRGPAEGLAFTPGGERVVVARANGSVNVLGARGCGPEDGTKLTVTRADFSTDASRVALMTPQGLHVVDINTCESTFLATPQDFPPFFDAISPDGTTAVAASEDGAARVWDVASRTLVATLLGDWKKEARLNIRRAAGGGEIVVSASDAGGITSWHLSGLPVGRVPVATGGPPASERDPVGALAVAFGREGALLVATRSGVRTREMLGSGRARPLGASTGARLAAFSGDGAVVAVKGTDGHVRVRRAGDAAWADLGRVEDVTGLSLDTHGDKLATTHGGLVRVWDTAGRRQIASVPNAGVRQSAAFAGNHLVVAGLKLAAYDLQSRERRVLKRGSLGKDVPAEDPVIAAAGTLVAGATRRGPVTVRDLSAERDDPVRLSGARGVRALAFAPSGAVLATAGEDGLRLWDTRTGMALITLAARPFQAVAFSRDGRWVIGGSGSGAQVFRCDACSSDDDVRAAADAFLGDSTPPIEIAPNPIPANDVGLAASEHSPDTSGGFAPPLDNPNATEDLTPVEPVGETPASPAATATATPQPEPVRAARVTPEPTVTGGGG